MLEWCLDLASFRHGDPVYLAAKVVGEGVDPKSPEFSNETGHFLLLLKSECRVDTHESLSQEFLPNFETTRYSMDTTTFICTPPLLPLLHYCLPSCTWGIPDHCGERCHCKAFQMRTTASFTATWKVSRLSSERKIAVGHVLHNLQQYPSNHPVICFIPAQKLSKVTSFR